MRVSGQAAEPDGSWQGERMGSGRPAEERWPHP